MVVTGSASSIEKLFRIQLGSESGPGALLDLTAFKRDSTSTLETEYKAVESAVGRLSVDESGGNDLVAAKKQLLIAIANSLPSKSSPSTLTEWKVDFKE